MKKFVIVLLFAISINSYGGKPQISYDPPICFGCSFSRCDVSFKNKSTFYGFDMSNYTYTMWETNLFGFYYAMSLNGDEITDKNVLGYSVYAESELHRFGFNIGRLHITNEKFIFSVGITPFYQTGHRGVSDTSRNRIGWSDEMRNESRNFYAETKSFGIKIDASFCFGNLGLVICDNNVSLSYGFMLSAPLKKLKY